jgi:dTDP-4-amino-4,6-dideoxygalactose transaminase
MTSVPFCSLKYSHEQVKPEVDKAIDAVYKRGQFILGPEVADFEKEYAAYSGTRYCIGVANGLDALYLSLKVLDIGPGDEVIVPAHTYIATWLAVSRVGATVVPVDVDPVTMLIDPEAVGRAITKNSKVVLPVHLYGAVCDMTRLETLARKHDLKIIEDNAQAHGAKWEDRMSGAIGDCNATSFYPTKNLGALGDGGAVITDNEECYYKISQLRNYGSTERFVNPVQGINSRLDELQAAMLRVKLRHLDEWNEQRKKIALIYLSRLQGVGDILLPAVKEMSSNVFHQFVIRTTHREKLKSFLFQKGIGTMVHYPIPPHMQEAYTQLNFKKGDFPISEQLADTVLSLPIWPGLDGNQIDWVIDQVKSFY